jgi:cytidine deaminase
VTRLATSIRQVLEGFPARARLELEPIVKTADFREALTAGEARSITRSAYRDLTGLMFALLPIAKSFSRPAISNFAVGAVAQGGTGALYLGANIEFKGSLNTTLHAEQSAIINAWLSGEEAVRRLAVSAAPCGHCRQFLYETVSAETLWILQEGKRAVHLPRLLPDPFSPRDLENTVLLMLPEDHELSIRRDSSDPVVAEALRCANQSHAPYTGAYAGVALQTKAGSMFGGSYAENAAFNPTVSPLMAAINMWNLSVARSRVVRVVLMEVRSRIDHVGAASILNLALGGPALEVFRASASSTR